MTLNVQDDTGTIAGANSYVSVVEFQDYWTARGVDYTATADAVIESYLIPATSYIDSTFEFDGYKLNGRDQTTDFPRSYLYDCSGEENELVEGVPREIKDAQCEYAHIFSEEGTLQPNGASGGNIKRKYEKVGPLEEETEYSPSGETGARIRYPQADSKIPACFVVSSGGLALHM